MVIMRQRRKFTVVPLANNATSLVAALYSGAWRQLLMESLVSLHVFPLNVIQTMMEEEFNPLHLKCVAKCSITSLCYCAELDTRKLLSHSFAEGRTSADSH